VERHDEPGKRHSGRPEEEGDDPGFAQGLDQKPDTPEEELEPNYARGISAEIPPGMQRHGRFSDGEEALPDTPEKEREGQFSDSVEDPDRDDRDA
jgi:hypothetical protein